MADKAGLKLDSCLGTCNLGNLGVYSARFDLDQPSPKGGGTDLTSAAAGSLPQLLV